MKVRALCFIACKYMHTLSEGPQHLWVSAYIYVCISGKAQQPVNYYVRLFVL